MTVLDGVGTVYDNYRVNSARVYIVGTAPTTSRSVANICLDYEPSNGPPTQDAVLRVVPNVTTPGYRDGLLVANKTSMMRRNWFVTSTSKAGLTSEDSTAFVLNAWTQGDKDDTWLVYCEYDVEFRNPAKGS
jgi:hypothetical protein